MHRPIIKLDITYYLPSTSFTCILLAGAKLWNFDVPDLSSTLDNCALCADVQLGHPAGPEAGQ